MIHRKDYCKSLLFLALMIFNISLTWGQNIKGIILDESSNPLINAEVSLKDTEELEFTNASGTFRFFDIAPGDYTLVVTKSGKVLLERDFSLGEASLDFGSIPVSQGEAAILVEEDFAVVSLTDTQLEQDEDNSEVSSLLSASRDIFLSTAAFGFGSARFRTRGFNSEYDALTINGLPMNELENGSIFFGQWGGLNDVLRNVHNNYGLSHSEYGIGALNGITNINIRAGSQREQTRASYALSNRTYFNRIMLTHSTGMNENGWAFSYSGSRRWAEEGHVTGTFYDSWSYFLGIEKKINDQHSVFFNGLGNWNRRGRAGAALQEIIDITGDRFYNPNWGYQNGEKRNSRVAHGHQPILMLGHDWTGKNDRFTINTAASYQFGPNGTTALNWDNGANPTGDYHQSLPSRIENPELREQVISLIQNEATDFFQVQWDELYNANQINIQSVENADGIEGNTRTGRRARYWVEDRRFDSQELNIASTLNYRISDQINLQGGARFQNYVGHNFAAIDDLLGADFHLDVDRFADGIANPGTEQKDLDNPNRIVTEGDIYGYDFNSHINKSSAWVQGDISLSKIDAFIGGELSRTSFYRVGNFRNGFFPDNSLGQSEVSEFNNYRLKAGLTYKLNGRNYFWGSAFLASEPPTFRDAFMQSRITNILAPNLVSSKQRSAEIGYTHKSPKLEFKATGYLADIDDETELVFFFSEEFLQDLQTSGVFGSFSNTNVDKRHVGVELAAKYKLNSQWSFKSVAALGQHLYDSRWQQHALSDELGFFREDVTVYTNGFFVESSPQTAINFEIEYSSPNFWFATLSANFFDNRYLDFSPDRRIEANTSNIESNELPGIVAQEKLPSAYTLDFFAYKSFKFRDHFIYLTASVNNILNNQNFITGGFEQLRFDPDRGPDFFAPKLYYAFGTNYFIGIALRL